MTASEATKDGPHSLLGLAVNRADVPAAGGGLDDASWVRALTGFVSFIPHTARLQVSVDEVAAPAVRMTLPWQAALVGDPHRHLVHGGVLTMFADTLCGSAVLTGLERPEVCPTLDLRLDHYRPGVEGMALIGEARVLRVTESMVFTEAQIWQQPGKLLCRAIGNFVRLGARNTPPGFGEALMAAAASLCDGRHARERRQPHVARRAWRRAGGRDGDGRHARGAALEWPWRASGASAQVDRFLHRLSGHGAG
ncbi:PaaI family thioesterase [Cobetia sp. ICG0124]|uniref:PaaI family thioesterase n=1 Tax=Cobetia sp. ICG0124 TaxID=2053669 RepID=UPI001F0C3DD9|nr:PaaI family thioesterase [Cobetia sp. ICG0124]